jgi:hypothetical protein
MFLLESKWIEKLEEFSSKCKSNVLETDEKIKNLSPL